MSFLDRVGNKVDKMKSRQSENSEVKSYNESIKEEKDSIDIIISKIGEYYWNAYANGEYEPPEEVAPYFEEVANRVAEVKALNEKIEERKKAGIEQRIEIDKNTQAVEKKKAEEAAERRRQREEAKRLAEEEKAAEEMTADNEE
jgi:hypothetical protein